MAKTIGLAPSPNQVASRRLLERARTVIPNGAWGHGKVPAPHGPDAFPRFATSGAGCRFRDADGNEFIDFMCGDGAMINGYAHPQIDAAAISVVRRGDGFAQATETSIELAEALTRTMAGMAWCAFGESGSDAIATAILVARAMTGRKGVVCFDGADHGSHPWSNWSNPGAGRPLPESADIARVPWNSIPALAAALEAGGGGIGALIGTAFHHPIPGPSILPEPGYWARVQALCRASGVLLIIDDVRTGFRLDHAGSHAHFGIEADLVCLSKALGNTHPIAATLGRVELFDSASEVFSAGPFWGASAPMAAALANLRILADTHAIRHMDAMGAMLCDGLESLGARHGLAVRMSGVPAIPSMAIEGDDGFARTQLFAGQMAARGVFLRPMHNWFLSNAHKEADIARTLEMADAALAATRATLGAP